MSARALPPAAQSVGPSLSTNFPPLLPAKRPLTEAVPLNVYKYLFEKNETVLTQTNIIQNINLNIPKIRKLSLILLQQHAFQQQAFQQQAEFQARLFAAMSMSE